MTVLFEQLGLLFMFLILGFVFGKSRLIDSNHSKVLSSVCVYLFLPCTIFKSFARGFTPSYIKGNYIMILASAAVLLVLVAFAYFFSKILSKDEYERKVFRYSIIIPNYGYMGYALAEGVFGAAGLLDTIVFGIPVSLYIYTFGYCMLTNTKLTPKRLLNPITMAIVVGIIFGLSEIQLPHILNTFVDKSSACMSPVCMLLTGLCISEFDMKKMFGDIRVYIICIISLLVIPLSVMGVFKLFGNESLVRAATVLYAMPCGLNTIVFAKLVGEDSSIGAKLALISNLMCCLTIPLCLSLI